MGKRSKFSFSAGESSNLAQHNLLTNQSLFEFSIEEYTLLYDVRIDNYNGSTRQLQHDFCTVESFDYSRDVLEAFSVGIFSCIIDEDYKIKGELLSSSSNYLNKTVSK